MSLGWQGESAILPSRAKPINNVDSKSAAVFGTEQKLASKSKSGRLRGSHEVRESSDVFKRKNKGIEERQEKEDAEFNKRRRTEDRVSAALRVKAEMYDKLSSDATSTTDSTLIDFSAKRKSLASSEKEIEKAPPEPTPRSHYEPPPQQQQWAWSTGREHVNDAEAAAPPAPLLTPAEMEQRIDEVRMSSGARVKSQWEKILSKDSHAILEQIHASTIQQRSAAQSSSDQTTSSEVKLSAKEERRRLLQQKRQEHMMQSNVSSTK